MLQHGNGSVFTHNPVLRGFVGEAGIDIRAVQDGESWDFPIKPRNTASDQLPLLIRGESERLVLLQVWFLEDGSKDKGAVTTLLLDYLRTTGLPIVFRLNGKNRRYTLHAKNFERYEQK